MKGRKKVSPLTEGAPKEFRVGVVIGKDVKPGQVRMEVGKWARQRSREGKLALPWAGSRIAVAEKDVSVSGFANIPVIALREAEASLAFHLQQHLI